MSFGECLRFLLLWSLFGVSWEIFGVGPFVPADVPAASCLPRHAQRWSGCGSGGQVEERKWRGRIRKPTLFQQQFSGQKIVLLFFPDNSVAHCGSVDI